MYQSYEVHSYYTQYMNQMSNQFFIFSKTLRNRWRSRITDARPACHVATLQAVGMGVDSERTIFQRQGNPLMSMVSRLFQGDSDFQCLAVVVSAAKRIFAGIHRSHEPFNG